MNDSRIPDLAEIEEPSGDSALEMPRGEFGLRLVPSAEGIRVLLDFGDGDAEADSRDDGLGSAIDGSVFTQLAYAMRVLRRVPGFLAGAVVDSATGLALAVEGADDGIDLAETLAAHTEVAREHIERLASTGDRDRESIVATLDTRCHLIRTLDSDPTLFCSLVLDRSRADLRQARRMLEHVQGALEL